MSALLPDNHNQDPMDLSLLLTAAKVDTPQVQIASKASHMLTPPQGSTVRKL
jgi:hypothetical protein